MQLAVRHLPAPALVRLHRRPAQRLRTATQLAKRGGAPQDRALYSCRCGFAWTAAVTTTVGCPHCGFVQAW